MRAARAPLIDQEDVPLLPKLRVLVSEIRRHFRRRRAGAAVEEDEGVRGAVGARGRYDYDLEGDLAAAARLPILPDLVGPAPRFARDAGDVARSQRRRRRPRRCLRAESRDGDEQERKGGGRSPTFQRPSPRLSANARRITAGSVPEIETTSPLLSTLKRRIAETISGAFSCAALRHLARIPFRESSRRSRPSASRLTPEAGRSRPSASTEACSARTHPDFMAPTMAESGSPLSRARRRSITPGRPTV